MGNGDLNDLHQAGALSADPFENTRPVVSEPAARKSYLRTVKKDESGPLPPPSDVVAEFALLAALIWLGKNAPATLTVACVRDIVDAPTMFFLKEHQLIFGAILAAFDEGSPADPSIVHSKLVALNADKVVGGLEFIEKLVAGASTASETKLRAYAKTIRESWVKRKILETVEKIAREVRQPKSLAADLVTLAQTSISEVAPLASIDGSTVTMQTCLANVIRNMSTKKSPGLMTGFRDLDEQTDGLFPKNTTIIGARTSVGKSTLAAQIALNISLADPKLGCLYVTLEMSGDEFTSRLTSDMAGVDSRKVRRGDITQGPEMASILRTAQKIATAQIHFLDSLQKTLLDIHSIAGKLASRLHKQGSRLGLIVIDHIGLVKPSQNTARMDRRHQVAETSRGLRWLAGSYDCHVIALAQLNRGAAHRKGNEQYPRLEDLKDCGNIEEDADNILLLHRPQDERGMFIPTEPSELIVAKNRFGPKGFLKLGTVPGAVGFSDFEDGNASSYSSGEGY